MQPCASAPSRNVDYTITLLYTVAITYLVPVNSLLSKYHACRRIVCQKDLAIQPRFRPCHIPLSCF
jgi:hypothetical protein